jgi:16S rRNA G966 N2-methylase RsmD
MNEGGIIVAEHAADKPLEDRISGYAKIKEKTYGTITVNIYSKDLEETYQ